MKAIKIVLSTFFVITTIVSCSKDEKSDVTISSNDVVVNTQLDKMNDDISFIVSEQLTSEDGINGKNNNATNSFLPACASVTRVPDYGTIITPGTTITKTIDFGTSGCALLNGNILKGIIEITFLYQPSASTHTINYEFINFYHNAVKIEGNKTFTRTMTTGSSTNPSHPIVTMNMDFAATFSNGNIYNRIGSRTWEIIEGYGNNNLLDNVYSVSGNWTTSYPNSSILTSTISTPLIVKFNCNHIVEGIITLSSENNISSLDYGDGTCDNLAVFTINGISFPILLGN